MDRCSRWATIALLLACLGGLSACGASDPSPAPPEQVQRYVPGQRLDARRSRREREGALSVSKVTYRAPGGVRVPALFAVPTRATPLGCVLYQGPLGTPKEATTELRQGLAVARLATFTIDPHYVGQRGGPDELATAIATPQGVRRLLLETVAELRSALDYLEQRRECRDNIALMGTAFGAAAGTLVAAQDRRVKGAMLTSLGASFKQQLLIRPLASERIPSLPNYVPAAASDPAVLADAVRILSPYDPERWIGKIAPRPVMVMNGRFDPAVVPGDAMALFGAARRPKTLLYYDGGHDPFAEGPARDTNLVRAGRFLVQTLDLPFPTS